MPIKTVVLPNHIIYGDWSDVHSDEFLVYYHPNGIDCTVFLMHGQDYGGGIDKYFHTKSALVDAIVTQEDKCAREIKEEVERLNVSKKRTEYYYLETAIGYGRYESFEKLVAGTNQLDEHGFEYPGIILVIEEE